MRLPVGKSYLYSPRGPIWQNEKLRVENEELLNQHIKKIAKKEGAIFWRHEPPATLNTGANEFSRSVKNVRKERIGYLTDPVQPKQTLIVDLTKSEEELLAGMHEKTRYNVRLAMRKGIRCEVSGVSDFEVFWKLMQETATRDKFHTHPRAYYETLLRVLGNTPLLNPPTLVGGGRVGEAMLVRLHIAYSDTTPLAAAIVGYFGDTATYLHGASSYEHRALMGPYGLHWTIMQEAKKVGYRFYDFWGTTARQHSEGIARFKTGFGGTIVDYPGTFDLPLNKFWYTVYRLGRKMM